LFELSSERYDLDVVEDSNKAESIPNSIPSTICKVEKMILNVVLRTQRVVLYVTLEVHLIILTDFISVHLENLKNIIRENLRKRKDQYMIKETRRTVC